MRKIRIFSAVLTLCMLFSLVPAVAFAADETEHVHSYTVKVLQEQTCEKTGVKKLTCACGDFRYEIIPLHKYDGGKVIEAATCGKAGVKAFTCTACGVSYKEVIPATGAHSYEDDTIIDATCTEPGKVGRLCSVCGAADGEITAVGEALGHDFKLDTSIEGYKAATCTEGGVNTYKCSRCDATKTEATAATGHTWNDGELVDDCEGQYVLYSCVKCDGTMKELTGLGEVKAHNWTESSKKEATCTEKGSVVYVCSACGQTRTEELAALGHNMVSTVVKATCKSEGYTAHTCSRCGHKEDNTDVTPVDPNAHEAGEGVILKAPTCTVAGVKKNVCKLCGASMGYTSIDPAHSWNSGEVTKAETCTEDGVRTFKCNNCDSERTEAIPAGHKYDGGKVTEAATCGKAGVMTYTCTACDNSYTEVIAATGKHEFVDDSIIEATCTEASKVGRICKVCMAFDGEITVLGDPLGHEFILDTSLEGYKAATCTEGGVDTYKCSRCDATKTEATAAVGHAWDDGKLVDDCEGQYVLYTCARCGGTMNELTGLGEVKAHTWEESAKKDATCTEKGAVTYTCSSCGKTRSDEIPTLGHDMVSTVVPATCTAEGYTTHACSRCDHKEDNTDVTPVNPTAHEAGEGRVLKDPTCTVAGVKKNICKLCGASMGYVSIDPAHSWNSGEVTKAATCTEDGVKTFKCNRCDAERTEAIPAGHKYDDGKVTTPATCGSNGVKTFTCTACGNSYTEVIPATGEHSFEDDQIVDATCTEASRVGRMCTVCGAADGEVTVLGEPLGHDFKPDNSVDGYKAATCTETGVNTYKCARCGEVKTETSAATGHVWNDGELRAADCETAQNVLYTCTVCGATRVEETGLEAALGHDVSSVVIDATCKTEGYTLSFCKRCGKEIDKTNVTPVNADAHTFDYAKAVILRVASCSKPGVIRVTCTGCGKTVYQEQKVDHTWDESTAEMVKAPTCTEKGELTIACSECGAKKTEAVEALGHNWSEEKVDDANTYVYQECTVCGEQKIIASLIEECEHEVEVKDAKAATCTENGYTGDKVCAKCGDVIEAGSEIPAVGHTEVALEAKAATCTEAGLTEGKVCTVCDTVTAAQETVPATGHTTELRNAAEATCTENGYTGDTVCTVCGEVVESGVAVEAHGHTEVALEAKAATCTEDGLTEGKVCTVCDTVTAAQETVPATGHDYTASAPIYSDDFTTYWYTYTCSHCNHSYNSEPFAS